MGACGAALQNAVRHFLARVKHQAASRASTTRHGNMRANNRALSLRGMAGENKLCTHNALALLAGGSVSSGRSWMIFFARLGRTRIREHRAWLASSRHVCAACAQRLFTAVALF